MEEKKENQEPQPIPKGQIWFDRFLVGLVLSLLLSGIVYNAWGLIELFSR